MSKTKLLLSISVLLLTILACNFVAPTEEPQLPSTETVEPNSAPTQIIQSVSTQPQADLPQTDAEVPRVPIDQAKAAFDSGDAVIVDVRGSDAYARRHIAGALEVSLSAIQTNPTGLNLDKNKWIITYCT